MEKRKCCGCVHGIDTDVNSIGERVVYCELRAEWMNVDLVIDWLGDTRCSNCGEDVNCTEPFCQHCGARLDEPEVKEY